MKSRKQVEKNNEDSSISGATVSELEVCFLNSVNETFKCVMNAFPQVVLPENEPAFSEESLKSISKWKSIFELDVQRLELDHVCDKLMKTTNFAVSCALLTFDIISEDELLHFLV